MGKYFGPEKLEYLAMDKGGVSVMPRFWERLLPQPLPNQVPWPDCLETKRSQGGIWRQFSWNPECMGGLVGWGGLTWGPGSGKRSGWPDLAWLGLATCLQALLARCSLSLPCLPLSRNGHWLAPNSWRWHLLFWLVTNVKLLVQRCLSWQPRLACRKAVARVTDVCNSCYIWY